jgi:hypothetical protein
MSQQKVNGPAAATVLAAGVGSAVFGITVVLAVVSVSVKDWLNWWAPAGPLVGKSSVGVLAWLVAWSILCLLWRKREVNFGRVWMIALALIALGFLLTFPPVFESFASH